MTPFPALAPHIDEAAASLRMVIDSTSLGFILEMSPSYGKLSITISGCVFENKVLCPLILIRSPFGPTLLKVRPDTVFCSLSIRFVPTDLLNS
ncbi:hypothetical protein D3C80_1530230 [compost metagenome]